MFLAVPFPRQQSLTGLKDTANAMLGVLDQLPDARACAVILTNHSFASQPTSANANATPSAAKSNGATDLRSFGQILHSLIGWEYP